jgi:hypothetical protein
MTTPMPTTMHNDKKRERQKPRPAVDHEHAVERELGRLEDETRGDDQAAETEPRETAAVLHDPFEIAGEVLAEMRDELAHPLHDGLVGVLRRADSRSRRRRSRGRAPGSATAAHRTRSRRRASDIRRRRTGRQPCGARRRSRRPANGDDGRAPLVRRGGVGDGSVDRPWGISGAPERSRAAACPSGETRSRSWSRG